MRLIMDIGNTCIQFGAYQGRRLLKKFSIKSSPVATQDDLGISLVQYFNLFQLDREAFDVAVIASVVPSLTVVLERSVWKYLRLSTFVVGRDVMVDIDCSGYGSQAGVDRLVNIVGAVERYGHPVIIVDLGTATTIDVADAAGRFIGGVIFPGIHSLNRALVRDTAKLPWVDIGRPEHVVGVTTKQCIQGGVYYGYLSAIDGLVEKMKVGLSDPVTVVATGGYAELLKECRTIDVIDENLTLDGIRILFERQVGRKIRKTSNNSHETGSQTDEKLL